MNDWRYLRARPGAAHLWAMTPNGIYRSACGRVVVLDVFEFTFPAPDEGMILKCRCCIPHERRRNADRLSGRS